MLSGPARLTQFDGSTIRLHVVRPGTLLLRVRYSRYWSTGSQHACLAEAPGGWITIDAQRKGQLSLRLRFGTGAYTCQTGRSSKA
jgi:hypothetical protein